MTELEELRLAYAECSRQRFELINKLKAQPEQQEPVAWWDSKLGVFDEKHFDHLQPLYTSPQPAQKQEPVAWGIVASNTGRICQVEFDADEVEGHNPKHIVPLYTFPQPSKPWVGLSEDEVMEIAGSFDYRHDVALAAEAKLREKNGG